MTPPISVARRGNPAPLARMVAGFVAVSLALSACGSSAETTSATTSTADTSATTVGLDLRGERYCEVLALTIVDGMGTADVYNSFPMNRCPEGLWSKLDAAAIAAELDVAIAVLNGPRFWLMNSVEKAGDLDELEETNFGGISMRLLATVEVGPMAEATKPYTIREVNRSTIFTFDAGAVVYELVAPDGAVYVMQSWSQQKDPSLQEADLAGLGSRLELLPGWSYRSRTLEAPLVVDTIDAPARVIQDPLGNSYSRETDS